MTKQFVVLSVAAMSFAWAISAPAQAQSLEQQLAQCTTIKNPLKRLVCFDDVAAGNAAAPVASSNSPVAATPAAERAQQRANNQDRAQQAETAASKRERFGFEHLPDEEAENAKPERMDIRIASYSKNRVGVLTIETTDGQVWEQISAERFTIKEDEPYYLERGLFGSYFFLGRDDSPRRTRVKRIK